MHIAATGSSGYKSVPSVNTAKQQGSQSGAAAAGESPKAEPVLNRLADSLKNKMESIGRVQSAFQAALSLNGTLESHLQLIH